MKDNFSLHLNEVESMAKLQCLKPCAESDKSIGACACDTINAMKTESLCRKVKRDRVKRW